MYRKQNVVETYAPGQRLVYTASEIGVARARRFNGEVAEVVLLRAINASTDETVDVMLDADDIRLLHETHIRLELGDIDVDEALGDVPPAVGESPS